MQERVFATALATVTLLTVAGCGGGANGQSSVTTTSPKSDVSTACTSQPVLQGGGLSVQATATVGTSTYSLHLEVRPFSGAATYPVTLQRTTWLDVVLVGGATTTDADRVARELHAAPGVISVDELPSGSGAYTQFRVTVAATGDVDGVLPSLHEDPAVFAPVTADSFFLQTEPSTPADLTLQPADNTVGLHAVSGSVTPSPDGHVGTFDVVVQYPYNHAEPHLAGQWDCPKPAASIGTAGTDLGPHTVTVTINSQASGFVPNPVNVRVGEIVEWVASSGSTPYRLSFADDPDVDSDTLSQGDTWEIRFTRAGEYRYTDAFFPDIGGTVVVTP